MTLEVVMPGKPGSGGPVPKRSDQRRRRNATGTVQVPVASAGPTRPWPEPDAEWHEIAQDWFRSLGKSGQAQFFEPSDIATARYVAEAMSQNLTPTAGKQFSSMLFAAVMSASSELLATEGARRRLRIELQREVEPDVEHQAAVTSMTDRRARMRQTS